MTVLRKLAMSFCVLVKDDLTGFCQALWLPHDATFDYLKQSWEWWVWRTFRRGSVCCFVGGSRVDNWETVLPILLQRKCNIVHVLYNRGLERNHWKNFSKM